jgi:DNA replication protein DnaD
MFYLSYVDDLKLYASAKHQISQLISLTEAFSNDINMSFGTDERKTQCTYRGKRQLHRFQLEDGGTIKPMQEEDTSISVSKIQVNNPLLKQNNTSQPFTPEGSF